MSSSGATTFSTPLSASLQPNFHAASAQSAKVTD
jgi:hypothetical protein